MKNKNQLCYYYFLKAQLVPLIKPRQWQLSVGMKPRPRKIFNQKLFSISNKFSSFSCLDNIIVSWSQRNIFPQKIYPFWLLSITFWALERIPKIGIRTSLKPIVILTGWVSYYEGPKTKHHKLRDRKAASAFSLITLPPPFILQKSKTKVALVIQCLVARTELWWYCWRDIAEMRERNDSRKRESSVVAW